MERHGRIYLNISASGGMELNQGWPKDFFRTFQGYHLFLDPENDRAFRYDHKGKLVGIAFYEGESVDLRGLPQDETIPSDAKLVELFNAHNITPLVAKDLIPA